MTRAKWKKLPSGGKLWQASLDKCECWGYHFPHRKGSGACDYSVRRDYYAAKRSGMSEAESLQTLNSNVLEADFK